MQYRRPLIASGILLLVGAAGCALITQPLVRSIPSEPANVDAATLERHVRELAVNLHPRSSENFSNLQRVGDYILAAFFASGGGTDVQKFEVQGNHYRNLTIVGRFGDFGITRRVKALSTGATNLPIVSINAPAKVPGVDFSDHMSYWHFKLPAVMVTDTAFLRNPNYHRVSDTPETLDYSRMAKVVQAVYAVARQY